MSAPTTAEVREALCSLDADERCTHSVLVRVAAIAALIDERLEAGRG